MTNMNRLLILILIFLVSCSPFPYIEGEEASERDITGLSWGVYDGAEVIAFMAAGAVRQEMLDSGESSSQNPLVHIAEAREFSLPDGTVFVAAGDADVEDNHSGSFRRCVFTRFAIGYEDKVYRIAGSLENEANSVLTINGMEFAVNISL